MGVPGLACPAVRVTAQYLYGSTRDVTRSDLTQWNNDFSDGVLIERAAAAGGGYIDDAAGDPCFAFVTSGPPSGDLTLHGVTRIVEVSIQAQRNGDEIEAIGNVDVALTDYAIEAPTGFGST